MKISATIITFNEEQLIKDCILSVLPVADEVIVVDSFSTDETAEICRSFKQVIFIAHAFKGHVQQKNFAIKQASNKYVLSLDADERLSPELQEEIKSLKKKSDLADAYSMPRLNNYCGHWIKHGGWYPDKKIRLWKKEKGIWSGDNPHDKVVMTENSRIIHLINDILHFTYATTLQHDKQIDKFTDIAAEAAVKKGKKVIPLVHTYMYPAVSFLQNYIFKLGFLDGNVGFTLARKHAYYKYLKYHKLRRLKAS